MPDERGHLSPAEITFIRRWIDTQHGSPYPCPVSGHTTWVVDEYVTQPIVFPVQPSLFKSVSPLPWPVVNLVCSVCGYRITFNAATLGLYPSPDTPMLRRG